MRTVIAGSGLTGRMGSLLNIKRLGMPPEENTGSGSNNDKSNMCDLAVAAAAATRDDLIVGSYSASVNVYIQTHGPYDFCARNGPDSVTWYFTISVGL